MKIILLLLIGVGAIAVLYNTRATCCYNGAVSSSNHYATQTGIQVLREGGNAIDAFVAMQAVLTVTEPHASGIGGGFFALLYIHKDDNVVSLDAREEAPDGVVARPKSSAGGASTGVPGAVKGLVKMLDKYGTWDLERCFKYAIDLAKNGWVLNKYGADRIKEYSYLLKQFNSSSAIYFKPDGSFRNEGETMTNPDLANTLSIIAKDRGDSFYHGDLANDIVQSITTSDVNPGNFTLDDLKSYIAVERYPIKFNYKGYTIYSMNSPSSSATVGFVLNILENFDLVSMGLNSADYIRTLFNAISIGFADRNMYMADSDWVDVPLHGILNKDYAKNRSALMHDKALTRVNPGMPPGYIGSNKYLNAFANDESMDTTHVSIIDKNRNIVSCTSTIEATFGNGMTVRNRGFLLNNELNDFSEMGVNKAEGGKKPRRTAIGEDKYTLGGKRPRSSMSPLIIFKDKKPLYAVGSPGGSTIISHVIQVIINIIDFKMNIKDAVTSPRFTTRNDDVWYIEDPLYNNTQLRTQLEGMGFNLTAIYQGLYGSGCVNVVEILNSKVSAAADFRRMGEEATY